MAYFSQLDQRISLLGDVRSLNDRAVWEFDDVGIVRVVDGDDDVSTAGKRSGHVAVDESGVSRSGGENSERVLSVLGLAASLDASNVTEAHCELSKCLVGETHCGSLLSVNLCCDGWHVSNLLHCARFLVVDWPEQRRHDLAFLSIALGGVRIDSTFVGPGLNPHSDGVRAAWVGERNGADTRHGGENETEGAHGD